MILSNGSIVRALQQGHFSIDPAPGFDPAAPPYNTSAIDLRLGTELIIPKQNAPVQLDLRKPGIARFLTQSSETRQLHPDHPFSLRPQSFVLTNTRERVSFPLLPDQPTYAARVEGKSSLARCGLLVHFTAPTIHAGFAGTITLEMINLGPYEILLSPDMYICQLIIEEVDCIPQDAPNQFRHQSTPAGT